MKIISLLFCFLVLNTSCSQINRYFGLQDDNSIEELTEELIETAIQVKTGFRPNIDLTPESQEN